MCSRFQLESRACALDSSWNREQLLPIPVGIESRCSIGERVLLIPVGLESTALDASWYQEQRPRYQREARAGALDSNPNREQCSRRQLVSRAVLSIPTGIESRCSRFEPESRAVLSIRLRIESNGSRNELGSSRIRIALACSRFLSFRGGAEKSKIQLTTQYYIFLGG